MATRKSGAKKPGSSDKAKEVQSGGIPKVLLLEDEPYFHAELKEELEKRVTVLGAFSVEEAEAHFAANPDIAFIAVDGSVPMESGGAIDAAFSLLFVSKARRELDFSGIMIAISSSGEVSEMLVCAGCDLATGKFEMPELIFKIVASMGQCGERGIDWSRHRNWLKWLGEDGQAACPHCNSREVEVTSIGAFATTLEVLRCKSCRATTISS